MIKDSVICTTYFSKKPHPNDPNDKWVVGRNKDGTVIQNDIKYIAPWYNSVSSLGLDGIVFFDNLDQEFINKYSTDKIKFIRTNTSDYSNNDWRFFVYRDFLTDNKYNNVFLTDGSDVTVIQDPSLIIEQYSYIDYFLCKDSINLYQFPFLDIHQQAKWNNSEWFLKYCLSLPLINMGVIGANYSNIIEFLKNFCQTLAKKNC